MSDFWIQTYTGKRYDFLDISPEMFCIEDIAHALSLLCRFTGHSKRHVSVAQHSILAASQLPDPLKLSGLLHDAAEAYLGDVASPLKSLLPQYKVIEKEHEAMICKVFKVNIHHPLIKEIDTRILIDEREQHLGPGPCEWKNKSKPLGVKYGFESAAYYERLFLNCFYRYQLINTWGEQR